MNYLWIAFGGALGSVARFWCAEFFLEKTGPGFPWGTIFVNVVGSFLIGFLAAFGPLEARTPLHVRQFLLIGLCGGFTTFSSFSLQTLGLASEGNYLGAAGNVVGSVVLCLIGVWLGTVVAALAAR